MKRNTAGVIALALAIGLGVWLARLEPTASGQAVVRANQLEYKIYTASDEDCGQGKAEVEFNKLAAEGWEYAGTIVSRPTNLQPGGLVIQQPPGGGPPEIKIAPKNVLNNQTCVLFKRIKQR